MDAEDVGTFKDLNRPPTEEAVDAAENAGLESMVKPSVDTKDVEVLLARPLSNRPTVRAGVYAWSFIGMVIVLAFLGFITAQLSTVIIPVVIALFPPPPPPPPPRCRP